MMFKPFRSPVLPFRLTGFFVYSLMLVGIIGCTSVNDTVRVPDSLVDMVNPLMGTDSEYLLSNGNTYPAIALPWGMNFWSPQTGKMGNGWAYTYDAHKIRGIKQTHQPSPWINDYAAFSLFAETGAIRIDEEERASWFSHKSEVAKPSYYQVYLADYDVTAEVTPTERAAIFRFTFPESDSSHILIDAFNQGSMVRILPDRQTVVGYCRNNRGGVPENFHNYFIARFDKPFESALVWKEGEILQEVDFAEGDHTGAVLSFKTGRGEAVTVRVASSFISPEQALMNLDREIGEKDFETVLDEANGIWNEHLGRIRIKGGTLDQQRTFYSCLYRTMLFPRMFFEYDADGAVVHYSPYNGKVLPGYMYTDNGFWDTFRAQFPLLTILFPELNSRIMEGLVNTYLESGWLPEWASPGHRNCMIGSNSASLITDSWLKGIRGYDIEVLYEAMVKNSGQSHPFVGSVGRLGAQYYNELGYVPYDVGIHENTARTLEYAYADYCIWMLARELQKDPAEIDLYAGRAMNYRNVFDPSSNLMRGRNQDGTFQEPFNPLKWGDAFTEGNSLHYTWSVFHDVEGLIDLMGGNDPFIRMLDTVFSMPPDFDCSYYGFPIHEIREMQIANMGNYAHGNQPIQHMIYLYNYAGEPWKAQYHAREVLTRMYHSGPDGYCGDEDNGQTSAWYVFSALGFYPVCPGTGEYVIGSPLFDEAVITLENGKEFVIHASDNDGEAVYIDRAKLNGSLHDLNYLTHDQIMKGGRLDFSMSHTPNKSRGVGRSSVPWSMSGFPTRE